MSTKPFLREPPLTTAFLLLFLKWGKEENKKTKHSNFPIWPQGRLPPSDVKTQDKALKLIRQRLQVKLGILKMTLKFSASTIKH